MKLRAILLVGLAGFLLLLGVRSAVAEALGVHRTRIIPNSRRPRRLRLVTLRRALQAGVKQQLLSTTKPQLWLRFFLPHKRLET